MLHRSHKRAAAVSVEGTLSRRGKQDRKLLEAGERDDRQTERSLACLPALPSNGRTSSGNRLLFGDVQNCLLTSRVISTRSLIVDKYLSLITARPQFATSNYVYVSGVPPLATSASGRGAGGASRSFYTSICLSIYPSVCLSVYLSID